MGTTEAVAGAHVMTVGPVEVEVVRKAIKHLHVAVYPPEGRVRVSCPLRTDNDAVRLAVVDKLAWIKRQQRAFQAQPRQTPREMVTGESHYVWGRRRRLRVVRHTGPNVVQASGSRLTLYARPQAPRARLKAILNDYYREAVKAKVPALLARWTPKLGVEVEGWGVRLMRTRWGSCNTEARRILLNTELAKKPPECLEYIVVHELVHLLERHHTDRFRTLMDQHLPDWRRRRDVLNGEPLAHEDWTY
ncbi:MAG: SprT family zinc-dependent metalloprotease [Bacteroidota bacterium]